MNASLSRGMTRGVAGIELLVYKKKRYYYYTRKHKVFFRQIIPRRRIHIESPSSVTHGTLQARSVHVEDSRMTSATNTTGSLNTK